MMDWDKKVELNTILQSKGNEVLVNFLRDYSKDFDSQAWEIFILNLDLTDYSLLKSIKEFIPEDDSVLKDIKFIPGLRFEVLLNYYKIINMKFGQAIEALKEGKKVRRTGWNGKDMFLWLKPATTIKSEWCKDPELKKLVDANGGEMQALGTICMYCYAPNGERAILSGWLASQTDMLSEDWEIVPQS